MYMYITIVITSCAAKLCEDIIKKLNLNKKLKKIKIWSAQSEVLIIVPKVSNVKPLRNEDLIYLISMH